MVSEETVKVETAMDILLVLLYTPGSSKKYGEKITGMTRLEKLVYLLAKETSLSKLIDQNFKYEPYHYGPYSAEVLDNMNALNELGFVKSSTASMKRFVEETDRYEIRSQSDEDFRNVEETKTTETFELTEDGLKVGKALFESLSIQQRDEIRQIKAQYNLIDLRQLLRYVYKKYPEDTIESRIKDYLIT